MSKVQTVRELVNQRLTAAVEEIFGLFERTIAEYEEELCRSKEKNERQQKLLDAVLKPEVRLHRAGIQQLVVVVKEEVPPEQQEWSPSLDQEDPPEPPHIKEEQEELWTSQEGEQLQGLEEADITKFLFTPVPVKSEDDEEKPQSSQLHQRQTEQMETGADGEDCGGPEPARNSHPDPELRPETEDSEDWNYSTEHDQNHKCVGPQSSQLHQQDKTEDSSDTEHSDDWSKDIREPPSGSKSLNNNEVSKNGVRCNTKENPFSCSLCGKAFRQKKFLKRHMAVHTGEKRFSCSVCERSFKRNQNLTRHMAVHSDTRDKPFKCSVCEKSFAQKAGLTQHMTVHKAEKLFSCSVCEKSFKRKQDMNGHMVIHSGEKRFSCSVCKRRFKHNENVTRHMVIHTKDKPFKCSVCEKAFTQKGTLTHHMAVHTGEKIFCCGVCDQRFTRRYQLRKHKSVCPQSSQLHQTEQNREAEPGARLILMRHMRTHTGEKLRSCSVRGKSSTQTESLTQHSSVNTGDRLFNCSVCNKRFTRFTDVKNHKCVGPQSSQLHQQDKTEDSSDTEHSDDWSKDVREPPSDSKSLNKNEVSKSGVRCNSKENPLSCSLCGKAFRQKTNLRRHMAVHTGEERFSCSVCERSFKRKDNLTRHMAIHTGDKPFKCSVCEKAFTQRDNLTQHMGIHSNGKIFCCSFCDKSFTWANQLRRHKRVCPQSSQLHPTEQNREAEPGASSSTEQMETGADGEDCGGPEPARNSHPDF